MLKKPEKKVMMSVITKKKEHQKHKVAANYDNFTHLLIILMDLEMSIISNKYFFMFDKLK